jgi:predicted HTH domain antitoxin
MEQVAVTVNIPKQANLSEFDVAMTLASRLYELGKITSGQAAEMVGLSKRAFIELLGKYNVSVFGYTLEDEDLSVL